MVSETKVPPHYLSGNMGPTFWYQIFQNIWLRLSNFPRAALQVVFLKVLTTTPSLIPNIQASSLDTTYLL